MDFLRYFARSARGDELGSWSRGGGRRADRSSARRDSLAGRRLLLVSGKGGTGKSTVTAALAVAMARQGKRVLVATADQREHLSTLFGVPRLSTTITPIATNISAVKVVPEASIREYGAMMLRSQLVYDAVFNRRVVQRLLGGVPGLNEWAVLGKVTYHSTELDATGAPRFGTVLFDAPATGHALDMLRVPRVIVDVAPQGPLRRDAEQALRLLGDPRHSGVVVVTLPEDLPTIETVELLGSLRDELELPVASLVINRVVDPSFGERERTALLHLPPFDPEGAADEVLACAVRRAALERVQGDALRRLAKLDVPQIRLPYLPRKAASLAAIEALSARFEVDLGTDRRMPVREHASSFPAPPP
jgi:anion-transporting  ArsA/GET3 family ATPase